MPHANRLSNREWEVVRLLLQGKSNKLIASALGISGRTVEFHLTNIYAKYAVASRIELILKLRNTLGEHGFEELRHSTVEGSGKMDENTDALDRQRVQPPSRKYTVSTLGKESGMKNHLSAKRVLVGVVAALLAGLLWVALLRRFEHMAPDELLPWLAPLTLTLALLGASVGLVGNRNDSSSGRVFMGTMFGACLAPLTILPLIGLVVLPVAKLLERLGLINAATMPRDVATTLGIIAMFVIWLFVGGTIGIALQFVSVKKPRGVTMQGSASEEGA